MTGSPLELALKKVAWRANIDALLEDQPNAARIQENTALMTTWAHEISSFDAGNIAIGFVREMQVAAQHTATLCSIAMYKASAATMRTMVECALYYTYFRVHPVELSTLIRDEGYFLSKSEIIEFHKVHTIDYSKRQKTVGLNSKLDKWYSEISSVVHGQIPGLWHKHAAISDIKYDSEMCSVAVDSYTRAVEIANLLFLVTLGYPYWEYVSSPAKKIILRGMSGDKKTALGLDEA